MGMGGIFSVDIWIVRYTNQIRTRYRNCSTTPITLLQTSKSLGYIQYTTTWWQHDCWLTVHTHYPIYIQPPERISQGHVQNGRRATFSLSTLYNTYRIVTHRGLLFCRLLRSFRIFSNYNTELRHICKSFLPSVYVEKLCPVLVGFIVQVCNIILYYSILYYIILIIIYYIILYYIILYYIILCYIMLCYIILCYIMLCYIILCYIMLCYVMLCYVMLCYVMLCYVI